MTGMVAGTCNPRTERWRPEHPWASLAKLTSLTGEFRLRKRDSVSKRWVVPLRTTPEAVLCPPHGCAYVHTYLHRQMNTHRT